MVYVVVIIDHKSRHQDSFRSQDVQKPEEAITEWYIDMIGEDEDPDALNQMIDDLYDSITVEPEDDAGVSRWDSKSGMGYVVSIG